jgi:hypothetical protein
LSSFSLERAARPVAAERFGCSSRVRAVVLAAWPVCAVGRRRVPSPGARRMAVISASSACGAALCACVSVVGCATSGKPPFLRLW